MTSGWQNKFARLSRMDWEEIRVRAGQELSKQTDLLRHRLGFGHRAPRVNFTSTQSGHFFFSTDEIAERVALVRQYLPEEAAAVLAEADEICQHRFRLLGYENLVFASTGGNEIDWHLDAVHGKRAPLKPWFQIPFLDFAAVGDHKVTWELNRHQYFLTLAQARLLSGDVKYSRELIAQWQSWIKANPYPLGINWGSTLEVAFRSLSWIWVERMLDGSPECVEFREQLLPALAFHGRYIEKYLSTYFSPNTHLLGEAVALFFLGTLYPQMPHAMRWKEPGWQIILHEAGRQVRPDGVYFEQSLHYHVYALDFFLHARLLAEQNGIAIPPVYDEILQKMLDVASALAQAGPAEGFGDDDGGRLWNPHRNRTEYMTDPLALGAAIYGKKFSAVQLTQESIWLFGKKALEQIVETNANEPKPPAKSMAFADGGVYVLAESQPFNQVLVVDAGPQGVGRSGHGHADALSIRLTMNGQRWLVDSGSGVYIAEDAADRNRFRGTSAHNTMIVDRSDQAIADEPFSWANVPTTKAESWITGKTFAYFSGNHDGYTRLNDPVTHHRQIIKVAGGDWLIRDAALGKAEHEIEIHWHFAPHLELRRTPSGSIAASPSDKATNNDELCLLFPQETPWQNEVTNTTLSPAYGKLEQAQLIRCRLRGALPAELATVLVATKRSDLHKGDPRFLSNRQTLTQAYELDYDGTTQGWYFALGSGEWSFKEWSSDARLLYFRFENEHLTSLVAIACTRLAWQEQTVVEAATGSPAFFEWNKNGAGNFASGEFVLTPWFKQMTLEQIEPERIVPERTTSSPTYAEKR